MAPTLFQVDGLLACAFQRVGLIVTECTESLEELLRPLQPTGLIGLSLFDIVDSQSIPVLEEALLSNNASTKAACLLKTVPPRAVTFGFYPYPGAPDSHQIVVLQDAIEHSPRTQKLEESLDILQDQKERLADLSSLMVHDLRNALQILVSNLDLVEKDFFEGKHSKVDARLRKLTDSSLSMSGILDEITKYLRFEIGEYPMEMTDLNEVVLACANQASTHPQKQVTIVRKTPFPTLICERQLVHELFANLIGNAVKYTKTSEVHIEIGLHQSSDPHPVFFIRDNGVGIHPDDLSRVFQPFQRADRNKLNTHGTGMGMAIAKKIVERHQGRIWLDSAPNQGTTVRFSLGPLP